MDVTGFPHQVGGHFGLLTCAGHVCKPLNQREYAFYQQMQTTLTPFTAKFCGRIHVNLQTLKDGTLYMSTSEPIQCHSEDSEDVEAMAMSEEASISSTSEDVSSDPEEDSEVTKPKRMTFRLRNRKVEAESVTNQWAKQCQSKVVQKLVNGYDKWFILLEDIVSGFIRPCVVDLKMGTRQYGDDASAQKRISQHQKCRQSTSEEMGVRMVGMQLYDRNAKQNVYVNKYEGRRMNRVQFSTALSIFLRTAGMDRVKALLEKLLELHDILNRSEGFRFYSSSLLIAFDGHSPSSSNISVKMIDFAHSTYPGFLQDQAYSGADDGYILGIDSLCKIIYDHINDLSLDASSEEELRPSRKRKMDLAQLLDIAIVPREEEPPELVEEALD